MKTPSHRGHSAFTLIELLTVISIIAILASAIVVGMGFVRERQAREKAKVQMGLISKALEDYKHDNSTYPPTGNGDGTDNSDELFKALFFDSDKDTKGPSDDPDQKVYIPELDPASKQGWTSGVASTTTKITDPWGNEYRYRTETDATGAANADTQNPGFDLWSVGKDGKTNDDPKHKDCRDDLKNF